MQVDFWFEFGSTYSYPTAMRIEDAARASGVALKWRPFLLGPIFRSQGWTDSPFNIYPIKGRYMWRDLERLCAGQGLTLKRPTRFPRNGLLAARVAACFAEEPWLPAFVRGIYAANFAEDREISDPTVVAMVLESVGQSPDLVREADTEGAKSKLRANTDEAIELGIFGAPSFLVDLAPSAVGDGTPSAVGVGAPGAVGHGELFWGNDRLEAALAWAHRER